MTLPLPAYRANQAQFRRTALPCRCAVCALLITAFSAFFAGHVKAYVLEGPKWSSSPVFQLELGNAGRTLIDGNTSWNNAVLPALTMWNQQIGRIQLGKVVGSTAPISSGDSYNSLSFATTVFGQSFGSSTLAVTYYRYSGSAMYEADTLFNKAKTWDSYRGALRFAWDGSVISDIQRVALHELGHAIGLDHPDGAGQIVDAIMNAKISARYTLANDDIGGGHALYGLPSSGSPPLSTLTTNIFWQNSSTGYRQIWVMSGTAHTATVSLGYVSTVWNIAALADFNGDGKRDILWQNRSTGVCTVWLLNGTTVIGSMAFPAVALPWQIATASDFNGDGKPDVVLQNNATGQRVVWLMNHTTYIGSVSLGIVGLTARIVGSGDFNGDGKPDILWQDNATGVRSVWLMSGTVHASTVALATVAVTWNIVGTGDFNADGKCDIVWQNQSTGQRLIWLMNRTSVLSNASLGIVPLEWNIRNY
jgi:hypothetical protein